jgi:multicomponent Na+:H+ antiporter subunit D
MMGLGLFSVAGVAGAIIFVVHQIPVKTVLFLVSAMVETDRGTSALSKLGGLVSQRPWLAAGFALPALSLAGLPPFSGFVAKLALVDAGIASASTAIVVVALIGSALTLLSMVKIWMGVFWGAPTEEPLPEPKGWSLMGWGAAAATVLTLVIAVVSGPLWDMSERAASELLDGETYVTSVMDPAGDVGADQLGEMVEGGSDE